MATISAKGRVKDDGTLDLHVATGLRGTEVEVLLVLEPLVPKNAGKASGEGGWPKGYFESTFGSLRTIRLVRATLNVRDLRQSVTEPVFTGTGGPLLQAFECAQLFRQCRVDNPLDRDVLPFGQFNCLPVQRIREGDVQSHTFSPIFIRNSLGVKATIPN